MNALVSAVKEINPNFFDGIEITIAAVNTENDWAPIYETATTLTIVGYAEVEEKEAYNENIYVTDSLYNHLWEEQKSALSYCTEYTSNYVQPKDAIYRYAFAPYDGSGELADNLLSVYSTKDFDANDTKIQLVGGIFNGLEFVDEMIENLSKIFLIAGGVIAVFACLLLSNFISMSISNKKREIGILRAVGARGSDVFKIFFSESFTITLICTVISIATSIGVCIILNQEVNDSLGASIFNFGVLSMAIIVALAILTAIVSTFLPVRNAAKKKPVESIRAL
jgi:ABC-type antimicrobial peptide transport system permease subunit